MRVYLAASMFAVRAIVPRRLRRPAPGRGFEVFVPHEHGLVRRDATPEAVFAVDAGGVESADAVLASSTDRRSMTARRAKSGSSTD
jgi:nucleoside 2-deoxyribosyltransferase